MQKTHVNYRDEGKNSYSRELRRQLDRSWVAYYDLDDGGQVNVVKECSLSRPSCVALLS